MDDETSVKLLLVQPTRRREWELRQGDELMAELSLPALRSGGSARAGDRVLAVATHGLFKREHVFSDAATGEELARVRGHTVELRGIESADWKSLGRGQGYIYPHADPRGFEVEHLPDELKGRRYYRPSGSGEERGDDDGG